MSAAVGTRAKCTLTGPILKAIVKDNWHSISQKCIDGSDEDVVSNNECCLVALAEHTNRLHADPVAAAIKEMVTEMSKSESQRYARTMSAAMSYCLDKKRRNIKKLTPSVSRVVAALKSDLDDASPCASEASTHKKNSDASFAAAASPRSILHRAASQESILAVYGVQPSSPRASTAKAPIDLLSPMTVPDSQPAGTPSPKRKLDRWVAQKPKTIRRGGLREERGEGEGTEGGWRGTRGGRAEGGGPDRARTPAPRRMVEGRG